MKELLDFYIEEIKNGKEHRIVARSINSRKELHDYLCSMTNKFLTSCSTTERIYYLMTGIEPGKCPHCENLRKFRITKKGYSQTCGKRECVHKAQQNTIRKNTPIHRFKTEKFKKQNDHIMNLKYGSSNYFSSEIGKKTIRENLIKKYGEDSPAKCESIKNKIKNTVISNTIKKYSDMLSTHNEKLFKYNVNGHTKILCEDCNTISDLSNSYLLKRLNNKEKCCKKCNPINFFKSKGETELKNFISTICEINENDRSLGFEIDILVPSRKIAFEFNGTYWHSDIYKNKNFHLEKTNKCKENGITLYHVWQDDWENRNHIVKSNIRKIFKIYNDEILVQNTECKNITIEQANDFFDHNDIDGKMNKGKTFGLFYKNILVCAACVCMDESRGELQMSRFTLATDIHMEGSMDKILEHVSDIHEDKIFMYCDKSWNVEPFFEKFKYLCDMPPRGYYVINGNKKYINDGEMPSSKNMHKIHDCGTSKWVFQHTSNI